MSSITNDVTLFDGWLRVHLPTGRTADFHARWLRHNDDLDRHAETRERTVDSSELPDDLAISTASVVGDTLIVRWRQDARVSHYKLPWLGEHAYAVDRPLVPTPPSDVSTIEIMAASGDPAAYVTSALECLRAHGATIVRRGPSATPPEAQTQPSWAPSPMQA